MQKAHDQEAMKQDRRKGISVSEAEKDRWYAYLAGGITSERVGTKPTIPHTCGGCVSL
jgi:hypothetical protein